MWAETNEDVSVIDFPYENERIPKGTKVLVCGTVTEENTICVRYDGKNRMVKAECLNEIGR